MAPASSGRRGSSAGTRRASVYMASGALLVAIFVVLWPLDWSGDAQLHTLLEGAASLLALIAALAALVRFYAQKGAVFLVVGAGFLGTAVLDAFHATVTSTWFADLLPSPLSALIPWSWNASRTFLAALMLLSWWAWRREERLGETGRVRERTVYASVGLMTPVPCIVIALVPLPRAYYPELFLGRPEELLAGGLFLLALLGYLGKGKWRTDIFEHWVVLSLLVGFLDQSLFMAFSSRLFDPMFFAAHLLKISSYGCVSLGLLLSLHELFARTEGVARDLRSSEARYRGLFESVPDGIYQTTADGRLLAANPALVRMLGYGSEEELRALDLGRDLWVDPEERRRWVQKVEAEGAVSGTEVVLKRRDGGQIVAIDNARAVRDDKGRILCLEGTLTDITERKKHERLLEHLVQFDPLTGLPNRFVLEDRLAQVVAQSRRSGERVALHYIDLDDFKNINDTLGHAVGDDLLQEVAVRLSGSLRETDTIARLGGDEFAVLQRETTDVAAVSAVARKLIAAMSRPFPVGDRQLHMTTSIGIALHARGVTPEELMAQADTALYKAKREGRNTFQFFDDGLAREVREYVELHQELHEALRRKEFFLEYQPQIELGRGRAVGVEALVRWRHPRRGVLYPGAFISVCERAGLIIPLGFWVLEEACRQCRAWTEGGLEKIPVALNVSPVQFKDPNFPREVLRIADRIGISHELLELELTESIVMQTSRSVREALADLSDRGIRFSIDDFGTGYSSLGYLRRFPFRRLKLAMEFVRGVTDDGDDAAIVDAVISLGHKLGLRVMAEGVEREEQAGYLAARGCDEAQGFFFARPMGGAAAFEWIRSRS